MQRIKPLFWLPVLFALLAGCATGSGSKAAAPKVSYKEDLYEYENGAFLATKKIDPEIGIWSSPLQLSLDARDHLSEILKNLVAHRTSYAKGSDEQKIIDFYLLGLDNKGRDAAGLGSLKPYLNAIQNADDIPSYLAAVRRCDADCITSSIVSFSVGAGGRDSSMQEVTVNGPDLGMGKEDLEDPGREELRAAYKKLAAGLLSKAGMPEADAQKAAESILALQKDLAASALSIADQYDMSKTYNVYTAAQLKELAPALDIPAMLDADGLGGQSAYIVSQPALVKKVDSLLVPEKLELLKNFSEFVLLKDYAQYLNIDMRNCMLDYSEFERGIKQRKTDERLASDMVQGHLAFEFGRLFVKQYFSEGSKKDIESMVRQEIAVYSKRIAKVDWMSDATKAAAQKKLDTMSIKIGYPDKWPTTNAAVEIKGPDKGGVLVDAVLALGKAAMLESRAQLGKPTDRGRWEMSPQTVNAYYNPSGNEIVFPAAILQPPFYSIKNSRAENLGGIGSVIGHELSHAFDTNGAQYDEKGNYHVWWTDEDYAKFKQKAKAIADYYDSVVVIDGLHIKGQQTVTENIADLAGVAVSTDLAGSNSADLKKYFSAYARLWAGLYSPEYSKMLLNMDPHSPGKARCNEVAKNSAALYIAYPDLKEGDPMYIAPEKRIGIW